jgi:2-methylisocitrate lyase-like PEP mutase family enzyme
VFNPLSAYRAMSNTAFAAYGAVRREETWKNIVHLKQTQSNSMTASGIRHLKKNPKKYIQRRKNKDE